jgi:uncharacterized protein YegL
MNTTNFYNGEMPENYQQKCPVCLVIDRSGSMEGDPIEELNKGLELFEKEIMDDEICSTRLDLSIVSFGSDTSVERDFSLINAIGGMPTIVTSGTTKLADGVRRGLRMLHDRKEWYKSSGQTYYRPYLILITDGCPDEDQDITGLSKELHDLAEGKHLNFWPIAVEGANMQTLDTLSTSSFNGSLPPMKLRGLEFAKLFKFLSSSFAKLSKSKEGERVNIAPNQENNPFQFTV